MADSGIREIPVFIKTYASYNHIGNTQFVGLRDSRAYDHIYLDCIAQPPGISAYIRMLKNQNEAECFEDLYVPDQEFKQSKDYVQYGYNLHDNSSMVRRAMAMDIVTRLSDTLSEYCYSKNERYLYEKPIRFFQDEFDTAAKGESKYRNTLYNDELPDEDRIVNVEPGTVADIFRRTSEGKVFLRAEYQFGKDGKWHPIPTKDISDNRKPFDEGAEHIMIPENQECYLMLSHQILTHTRITNIINQLELDPKKCRRVTPIPVLDKKTNGITTKKELELIKQHKQKNEPIPYDLYLRRPEMRDVLIEKDKVDVTVLLPDYEAYANTLYEEFMDAEERYEEFIGHASDDDKLKYLLAITCAQNPDYETHLDTGMYPTIKDDLGDLFRKVQVVAAWVNLLAERLAWWIFQPGYQEVLYDYEFQYERNERIRKEKIDKLSATYISSINKYASTTEALKSYYGDAQDSYKAVLREKNSSVRDMFEEYYISYCRDGSKVLNDTFSILEMYVKYHNRNYLAEIFSPKKSTEIMKLSLKFMEAFSAQVVAANNAVTEESLLNILETTINRIANSAAVKVTEVKNGGSIFLKDYPAMLKILEPDKVNINLKASIEKAMTAINLAFLLLSIDKAKSNDEIIKGINTVIKFALKWGILEKGDHILLNWVTFTEVLNMARAGVKAYNLYQEGDTAAATVELVSSVVLGVGTIITTCFSVTGAPVIIIAILEVASKIAVNILRTTELERWMRFSYYGEEYKNFKNGSGYNENMWKTLAGKYLRYQYIDDDSDEPTSWKEVNDWWTEGYRDKELSPQKVQIDMYYHILNDITLSIQKFKLSNEPKYLNTCDAVRFDITGPIYGSNFTIKLVVFLRKMDRNGFGRPMMRTYTLNTGNRGVYTTNEGTRSNIWTYLYSERFSDKIFEYQAGEGSLSLLSQYYHDIVTGRDARKRYLVDNDFINRYHSDDQQKEMITMLQLWYTDPDGKPERIINRKVSIGLADLLWDDILKNYGVKKYEI